MTAFYELRLYQVAPGRMNDMLDRVQHHLPRLFSRHSIQPLAYWYTTSGPNHPLLVYLTPWESMEARSQAWGGFYSDPEWHQVRTDTNAGSEMVTRYELNFLRAIQPLDVARAQAGSALELYIPEIAIGASAAAQSRLLELAQRDVQQEQGFELLGAYEYLTGDDLPRGLAFLNWRHNEHSPTATLPLEQSPLGRAQCYRLQWVAPATA